jgi:hypothetical protein
MPGRHPMRTVTGGSLVLEPRAPKIFGLISGLFDA